MPHVDEKVFLEFHAISLVNGLKYWLIREAKIFRREMQWNLSVYDVTFNPGSVGH